MTDKHIHHKETDITPLLVVILVVMVAVAVIKLAGDFSNIKTSSSTKAAPKKGGRASQYDAYCQKKFINTVPSKYASLSKNVTAYTYQLSCGDMNYKVFNPGGLLTSASLLSTKSTTEPGICCIPLSVMYVLNDQECTKLMPLGHWSDGKTVAPIPAICKNKSDCSGSYGTVNSGQYTVPTSVKCDSVSSNFLNVNPLDEGANRCCMMPLPTVAP